MMKYLTWFYLCLFYLSIFHQKPEHKLGDYDKGSIWTDQYLDYKDLYCTRKRLFSDLEWIELLNPCLSHADHSATSFIF